jgi:endonuclease YncB( thermonuclease family)
VALTGRARADDVAGQASVVDGDTFGIHGIRVGLFGIDAPNVTSSAVTGGVIAIVADR